VKVAAVSYELPTSSRVSLPVASAGEPVCRVLDWKPTQGNPTLAGRASVCFQGGWIVSGIPIFRRPDGALAAGSPTAPLVGSDGMQLTDNVGKRRYAQIISFESEAARRRWDAAICAALAKGGVS
jgi:hypothetical protein